MNLADLLLKLPGRLAEAQELCDEALEGFESRDESALERIWKIYNLQSKIADTQAAIASDPSRTADLRAEAAAFRKQARDARRAFPGTRTQLRPFGPLIVAAVLAAAGEPRARRVLASYDMPNQGYPTLSAVIDRILGGERDPDALCAELLASEAMIVEYILESLTDIDQLTQWMPTDEASG
jgi:hypothetical protein